ncbi:MAG TPA: hypothetical protein VKC89_03020 [Patescibacteria group bacterium]|nr:hypothetical protein [Patescibacteria group bacterium]
MSEREKSGEITWRDIRRNLTAAVLAGASLGLFFDTVLEIERNVIDQQAQRIGELEEQIKPSLTTPNPTEIPTINSDEQKIAALRKIQQESVKRDNFIVFLPQAVLDNGGRIREISDLPQDGTGFKIVYDLLIEFPPSPEDKLLYVPSFVEGTVINLNPKATFGPGEEFDVEMGDQIWHFDLKNKGGSRVNVAEGDEIKLGEPLFVMNTKGSLNYTFGGNYYSSDTISITARHKSDPSYYNYLTERIILKDSFSNSYITVPLVEPKPKQKRA